MIEWLENSANGISGNKLKHPIKSGWSACLIPFSKGGLCSNISYSVIARNAILDKNSNRKDVPDCTT